MPPTPSHADSTCTPSATVFARRTGVDIKRRRLVLAASDCDDNKKGEPAWPRQTGELCARCLQPFDGVPWPRPPVSFSIRERLYLCAGYLCGPRCYKALILERCRGGRREWADETALAAVARDYFDVELADVEPAPPLEMLAVLYADALRHRDDGNAELARRSALALYRGREFVCERVRCLPFVRVTFFCEMALADDAEQRKRESNAAAAGTVAATTTATATRDGERTPQQQQQRQMEQLRVIRRATGRSATIATKHQQPPSQQQQQKPQQKRARCGPRSIECLLRSAKKQ